MKQIFLTLLLSLLIPSFNCLAQEKEADERTGVIELSISEFSNLVYDITQKSEKDVFKFRGDKPAIVDFSASWCRPCQMMLPILEKLAEEYADKIVIYKIDVDKEGELASGFGVRSVPTLMFCPLEGKPVMATGSKGEARLKEEIEKYLKVELE